VNKKREMLIDFDVNHFLLNDIEMKVRPRGLVLTIVIHYYGVFFQDDDDENASKKKETSAIEEKEKKKLDRKKEIVF
jgi:hypothetical protein